MTPKSLLHITAISCTISISSAQQVSPTQQASSKTPPAAPATYQGCVSKLPKLNRYVLASGNRCMLLTGDFKAETIADHAVMLHGSLFEPWQLDPLTLKVDKTAEVRNVCSQTCTLEPPGTRGVHGKEKPGSEGGPPGVIKTPPKS